MNLAPFCMKSNRILGGMHPENGGGCLVILEPILAGYPVSLPRRVDRAKRSVDNSRRCFVFFKASAFHASVMTTGGFRPLSDVKVYTTFIFSMQGLKARGTA